MSYYDKNSVFAKKPVKTIFELLFSIGIIFFLIYVFDNIQPPIQRGGRPDPNVRRCTQNERELTFAISEYNSSEGRKEKIDEINEDTIKILIKELLLEKNFAPPLKECEYKLTDEKTDFGNKVICEYHEKLRLEQEENNKEKKKNQEKLNRMIKIFIIIWGILHALSYFLLALNYNEKKRNIIFITGSIISFLLLIIISYFLSPVQKIHVTNYNGEHYIAYRHIHPLSELLPFLERREYIKDSEFIQKWILDK